MLPKIPSCIALAGKLFDGRYVPSKFGSHSPGLWKFSGQLIRPPCSLDKGLLRSDGNEGDLLLKAPLTSNAAMSKKTTLALAGT